MDHIKQCAHEYAEMIAKYSNVSLHDLSDTWGVNEDWRELVSSTDNPKEITRFDGVYRSWSMPDGYCGLVALKAIQQLKSNDPESRKMTKEEDE